MRRKLLNIASYCLANIHQPSNHPMERHHQYNTGNSWKNCNNGYGLESFSRFIGKPSGSLLHWPRMCPTNLSSLFTTFIQSENYRHYCPIWYLQIIGYNSWYKWCLHNTFFGWKTNLTILGCRDHAGLSI